MANEEEDDAWPLFQTDTSSSLVGTTTWEALRAKMGPIGQHAGFKANVARSLDDLTDLFEAHRRRVALPDWPPSGFSLPVTPEESAN